MLRWLVICTVSMFVAWRCAEMPGLAREVVWQVSPANPSADLETQISLLINQLGDADYHVRVRARWELGRIGLPAFSQLREAVNHPKIQIASAARYLVQSQNVVWWLETDSTEVRRLLMDYNALNEVERDTRLQRLARMGSQDALLALCRLARFESNEGLSKSAALYLLESVADSKPDPNLPRSILLTIENDNRRAAQWLRTLTQDLLGGDTQLDVWEAFAAEEAVDAAKLQEINEGRRPAAESNVGALRFNNWLGRWLTARVDRDRALQAVRQSMNLVSSSTYAILEYVKWALDARLPELVVELAQRHVDPFQQEPQLGFLLAECYLRAGDEAAAEATAAQASHQIRALAEKMTLIAASMKVDDMVANRRIQIAKGPLVERGMFPWAEREFQLAIELETSSRIEAAARGEFAEFYWNGGEYEKAVEVLRPLFDEPLPADESGLPGRASELTLLVPYYYYYQGLMETERHNYDLASELLVKAVEAGDPSVVKSNPDIVIAMKKIADNEVRRALFESYFDEMVQDFRAVVIQSEHDLAESPDRRTRAYLSLELATNCNQLAWLLSRCEVHGDEAVNLSRRSLEFYPDEPAFLDTLGRCYFTAGDVDAAVKAEEQALKASPYDRQMRAQLAEFKTAQAKQSTPATAEAAHGDK